MYDWVQNVCSGSAVHPENVTLREEDDICELHTCDMCTCDCALKIRFTDLPLNKFWMSVKEDIPTFHGKEIDILLKFLTSYMCQQAFSNLTSIKRKDRNCFLLIENEIRVCLSKARPSNKCLCSKRQAQVSHWRSMFHFIKWL